MIIIDLILLLFIAILLGLLYVVLHVCIQARNDTTILYDLHEAFQAAYHSSPVPQWLLTPLELVYVCYKKIKSSAK